MRINWRKIEKKSLLEKLIPPAFFLLALRGTWNKTLTYSDFWPFADAPHLTWRKFAYVWSDDFLGFSEPKSLGLLINLFFESVTFFNAHLAQTAYFLTLFLIAYYGMRKVLERYRLDPRVNFLVPFLFVVNPVVVAELSNGFNALGILYVFTPFLFLTVRNLLEHYTPRWGVAFSVLVALFLMNIQIALWTAVGMLFFLVSFALFRKIQWRHLAMMVMHGALGVLLNAMSVITLFTYSKGYTNLSYLDTFRDTYSRADFFNFFRLIGNNGSSQPLLGYFEITWVNLAAFGFFGIIVFYLSRLNSRFKLSERIAAVFTATYLLFAMLLMYAIKAGALDHLIVAKNLLLVSARNPHKIFFMFAFCFVLLLALALNSFLQFAELKWPREKTRWILPLLFLVALGQNRAFLTGDFALSQTRGVNGFYVEEKYNRLFGALNKIEKDAQVMYLPFDYELQLKTFWRKEIVKYKMGAGMLDGTKNSDMLTEMYGEICAGRGDFRLFADKLNLNYVVLDKHPTTDLVHNLKRACEVETYYDSPYVWGEYEFFNRVFAGREVFYEDENFKVLKLGSQIKPEIFAVDQIFSFNNADNLHDKYDIVHHWFKRDFNFAVNRSLKKDPRFTYLNEITAKGAKAPEESMDAREEDRYLLLNRAKTNLYYRFSNRKIEIFERLENRLLWNGGKIIFSGNEEETQRVLSSVDVWPGKKYFLQTEGKTIPLKEGMTEELGIFNRDLDFKIMATTDPFKDLAGLKIDKLPFDHAVFYYNQALWRAAADEVTLQKSVDGGKSWTDLYKFPYKVEQIIVTAQGKILVPQDPDNNYWQEPAALIYRSSDGGKNFVPVLKLKIGGVASWSFDVKGEEILLSEYGAYGSGHVFYSADGGANWKMILTLPSEILPFAHVHKVLFDPYLNGVYYVSNGDLEKNMRVWFTKDGGNSWQIITDQAQPTWLEANQNYLFLFGDLTGQIQRISKADLLRGGMNIETVYDATQDPRGQFGKLSFYSGAMDKQGNIFAGGVAYGKKDTHENNQDAVLLGSFDSGASWQIIKTFPGFEEIASGPSFMSHESNDEKIYLKMSNDFTEVMSLKDFKSGEWQKEQPPFERIDENPVTDSNFENGGWSEKVEDCNAHDRNANIAMDLVPSAGAAGKVLELAAETHIACSSDLVNVEGGREYVLGFDYQSDNARDAGFFIIFNDPQRTSMFEKISLRDKTWRTFARQIQAPPGATEARLYLYAFSGNQKEKIVNHYDGVYLMPVTFKRQVELQYMPQYERRGIDFQDGVNSFGFVNSQANENVISNGAFERGPWQDEVEDCRNYDNQPRIFAKLLPADAPGGGNALKLGAKKHSACAHNTFALRSGNEYNFSFDYQSSSARQAHFLLEFNNAEKTVMRKDLEIVGKKWHQYSQNIKVPVGATEATLYIYANESDRVSEQSVAYANFKMTETPDTQNAYYYISSFKPALQKPRAVEMTYENPTKRRVRLQGVSAPFLLGFMESFDEGWRAVLDNDKVNRGSNLWHPWVKPDAIAEKEHLQLNGFMNGWFIDPQVLCVNRQGGCRQNADGSFDIDLLLEFAPQRRFYFSALVSVATGIVLVVYLLQAEWTKRRHQNLRET